MEHIARRGLLARVSPAERLRLWPRYGRSVRYASTGPVRLINAGPISWPVTAGTAPATIVTVEGHPRGDQGRYAARLRRAGVAVDEMHCTIPDLATGKMVADLGQSLRRSLPAPADEPAPAATTFRNEEK
jgi:hypothetical protein